MNKASWLFWGIIIVCIGIIAEVCILLVGNSHHPPSPISTLPTYIHNPYTTTQGSLNVTTIPAGFFLLSNTHAELLFAATVTSFTNSSNGIHATLSFSLENNTQQVTYTILLVPKGSSLLLIKRNTPDLFSPSATSKQILIPFTGVVTTLKPYLGKLVIFSFVLKAPKIGQHQFPTTGNIRCNQQFSTYIAAGQQAPTCLPSPESMTVYEKF